MIGVKSGLFALAVVAGAGCSTTALAADFLDDARQKFVDAYDKRDYPAFCRLLDNDVEFRGAIEPGKWTHTADEVIKRFRAPCTCTEYAKSAQCSSSPATIAAIIRPFSIVSTNLALSPTGPPATDAQNATSASYALDSGDFRMDAKPGSDGVTTIGHYVILWIKDGDAWKLKQIDMQKAK